MTIYQYSLIAIAVVIAGLRIAGVTHWLYQPSAHVFVGGLIGAWLVQRKAKDLGGAVQAMVNLILASVLILVEVACALWFRFVQ